MRIFGKALLFGLLALLLFNPAASASDLKEPKRVLVLYSFHEGLPWDRVIDDRLRTTLKSKSTAPIELNVEHTDRVAYPGDAYPEKLVDLYRRKYSYPKMDIIIGFGDEAADILLKYGDELFPEIPIILVSVERKDKQRDLLKPNMTSLSWGIDTEETVGLIQEMLPEMRHLFVISGSSVTDQGLAKMTREVLAGYKGPLEIHYLTDLTEADLLERVTQLPKHSVLYYLVFSRDADGKSFVPREIMATVSERANAPMFGLVDTYLGHGIVGGILLSAELQGKRCAEIALRILDGKSPKDILPVRTLNLSMFDWRQLKRWGISEDNLPPGSIVRYKERSFWALYKWYILGGVTLCIVEALLIFGLLLHRATRRRVEQSLIEAESDYRTVADFTYDWEYWENLDGTLRYVSPSCERISGYKAHEFIENPPLFREIIVPEDRDIWDNHSHDSHSEPGLRETQFRIRTRDGEIRWIEHACQPVTDSQGEFLGFRASNRDITERKRVEETIRERDKSLTEAQRIAHLGNWVWNIVTNELFWSDEIYRIFGLSPQEFDATYDAFLESVHRDDRESVEEAVNKALEDPNSEYSIEHRVARPDGSERTVHERAEVIFDDTGRPIRMIGTVQDITERKQAEQELRDAFSEIERLKEQLEADSAYLQEEIKLEHDYESIIGQSESLKYILYKVEQIASSDTTVLILGETGAGKELVARAIHNLSPRKDRPLVKVNCATLPSNLIESELFGHEKGAFTGADTRHAGRFELAHGTTLFLDEIGELALELQAKLLRVLEHGELERLGSSRTIKVDVRVIAVTNRNLEEEVRNGRFREDLWYRLNIFPVTVPPLRDRPEDIPLLVNFFVDRFARKLGKSITIIPTSVMKTLQNYPWPGNVRELENVIERAVINTSGPKLRLVDELRKPHKDLKTTLRSLEDMERDYIVRVLEETKWRIDGPTGAALILGLNPSTLRSRMQKLRIQKP